MSAKTIFLDYAAATPISDNVMAAMSPYYSDKFYNPSANYIQAMSVRRELETARARVAHWIGAKNTEIIFTAGGTEANNLAIKGIMNNYPNANVVISAIEHESVKLPAERYSFTEIVVDSSGRINNEDLATKINDETVLVSVMYANNEIGTIQQLKEISQIINQKRLLRQSKLPLYLHTDACQAANYLDLHASRLGVDMMTLNGGKLYGPKQSGCLYVKTGIMLQPLIDGGGQERNIRSGTENVAASVGFSVALDDAQNMRKAEIDRLHKLQSIFFDSLAESVPSATVNGSKKHRLPNNIHITFPGIDNERLLIQLDEAGIMAAAGSACSASNDQPSHVLAAIGASEADARSSIRLTMGKHTSEAEVIHTVQTLTRLVNN